MCVPEQEKGREERHSPGPTVRSHVARAAAFVLSPCPVAMGEEREAKREPAGGHHAHKV